MRELPTEIWYSVLSYLELGDQNCFSRCSKACYFAAFPIRFKGAHLLLKDGSSSEYLQWFEDGELLVPLRRHIRAATYYSLFSYSQRIITPPFHHLQSFSNISRVVINLPNNYNVKRELFIAILTSLRTLNYYDEIQELVFQWGGSCDPVASKISDTEFGGLALDGLGFPKRLQSLTIESNRIQDPCHLSFLVTCDKVTTLCLTDATVPTMDPRQPDTIVAFSTIKKLTLHYTEDNDNAHEYLQLLSIQFPNLESLTISLSETIPISDYRQKSYFKYITGLPSLTHAEIPFPKTYSMGRTMCIFQARLRRCFMLGGLKSLRLLSLRGRSRVSQWRGVVTYVNFTCGVFRDDRGSVRFGWRVPEQFERYLDNRYPDYGGWGMRRADDVLSDESDCSGGEEFVRFGEDMEKNWEKRVWLLS